VANRGFTNRLVLEQSFHDLRAHFPVQTIDRLSGRVAGHAQDSLGFGIDQLAGLVSIEDDLRAAQYQANGERRQQNDAEQLPSSLSDFSPRR
jgi:hypothetical protein